MLYRTVVGRSALLMNEPSLPKLAGRESVMLCVHGMYGGAWYYGPWLEQFEKEGFGALALDLRGHHGTALMPDQKLDDVTMRDYVDDVAAVIDHLTSSGVHRKRIVLLGHSMGGLVAQMYAAEQEIGALVLVASAIPQQQSRYHHLLGGIAFHFIDRMHKKALLPPDERRARRLFIGIPEPLMSETIARLVPESARARNEVARGITLNRRTPPTPTLIVAGRRDPIVPSPLLYTLHLGTPGSKFTSSRSGHFPMLEPVAARLAHRIVVWARKAISR